MTDAQKRFCDEYIIDFNATRAYKTAYPGCSKDSTARTNASKLLTKANIQEYLSELKEERSKRTQLTQDMVINELKKIAFVDIRKLYDENGNLKNIQDIDNDTAGAIAEVQISEEKIQTQGEDTKIDTYTKKVKTYDKKGALEILGKHLGMFKNDINLNQDKPFEVNITVRK